MYMDERHDKEATRNEVGAAHIPPHPSVDGKHIMSTYWSMEDAAEYCLRYVEKRYIGPGEIFGTSAWNGGDDFYDVMRMCRTGWDKDLGRAIDDVEEIVRKIETDYSLTTRFQPEHDFSGGGVDIDAYLHGQPENMITYPAIQTSGAGRVIAVAGSISASCGTGPDAYYRRGSVIGALALAMERQGMQTELWLDDSAYGGSYGGGFNHSGYGHYSMTNRVLVKGANDALDMGKVMLAFAHPGALRHLAFGLMHAFPKSFQEEAELGAGMYGCAMGCNEVLPEGSIYLPCQFGEVNGDEMLVEYLKQLDIIKDPNIYSDEYNEMEV